MASSPSITRIYTILFLSITTTLLLLSIAASALEFTVGGPVGWNVPSAQEPDYYNHWASRNRFHVGDTLNFLNEGDSVLVVSGIQNYMQCNTTDPIQQLLAGNTTFQFAHYGFYYFISGQMDHCLAGQRMIVRVMVHPEPDISISPSTSTSLPPAPSPSEPAAAPGAYYNEPTSSPTAPSNSSSGAPHKVIGSAVKIGAGYGFLSLTGALLVLVGLI